MRRVKVYKVFWITNRGNLRLFTGTNFKSEGEAQRCAVEAKIDAQMVILPCYIDPRDD